MTSLSSTLAMKVTSSWIIYSCLIFGTGTVCDRKLGRRQAVSFRPENTDDKFQCFNGRPIEWSLLCDGFEDCSDGSDETKQLCALYEFGKNLTKGCGEVQEIRTLRRLIILFVSKLIKVDMSIRLILNKHVAVNSCTLPTVEGVIYSYEGSDEILSHGTLIDRHVIVIENCEVGYHKASLHSFRICLGKGKWLSSPNKLCFKMCPPLESDSLDIICTYNGNYVNCSNPSIPDTIAKPLCKSLYTTPNGHEEDPLELLCQPNGAWNKELYRCNPSCGKVYTINNGMIVGGKTASNTTTPWNVAVYRLYKKNSTNYDLICGGSIISPNLVVSAAHCFWVKGMLHNIISVNDGQYKIAVGKNTRNITMIDTGCTKILNVKTIHLNEYYHGVSGFHADDIAIIVLQKKIPFSIGVSPICVDWTGKNTIPDGAKGKIVGWGKTEKGNGSLILLEVYLPIINYRSCRNMYTNGFESYVTKDKFCAGSALGQGVHEGDSGAGLSISYSNNLDYLTGIASVKDPDTNNSIALFTDVKHHIGWISRLYNNKTL